MNACPSTAGILHSQPSTMLEQTAAHNNLLMAWQAVQRNHGGPGPDHRRIEDVTPRIDQELASLRSDLLSGAYQHGPIQVFPVRKPSGGLRDIALANVRDRIAGRALAQILTRHCNGRLSPHACAFRPHNGPLKAVAALQRSLQNASHVLRADIASYFDEIDHGLLSQRLRSFGLPEDVVSLSLSFARASRFDGCSSCLPTRGIPQGSPLSPLLANLYLDSVDRALEQSHPRFLRYADDIAVLANNIDAARDALDVLTRLLAESHLRLSTAKTRIYSIDEGFLFLGFLINRQGHSASSEARERLREKLDAPPHADELPSETRERRASILRGWNNYFHYESPQNQDPPMIADPQTCPTGVPGNEPAAPPIPSNPLHLRQWIAAGNITIHDPLYPDLLCRLADWYESQGMPAAARACRHEAGRPSPHTPVSPKVDPDEHALDEWFNLLSQSHLSPKTASVDRLGRLRYSPLGHLPRHEDLLAHLAGKKTLSLPIYHSDSSVRVGVIDFDLTRAALESLPAPARGKALDLLRRDAMGLAQRAREVSVPCRVECSGFKGFHLWFLLADPIPASEMLAFLKELCRIAGPPPADCQRELFPSSSKSPPDGGLTHVKLPLGLHPVTGHPSVFLDPTGEPESPSRLPAPSDFFCSPRSLRAAVQFWSREHRPPLAHNPPPSQNPTPPPNPLNSLRGSCAVLDALCRRAEERHDLSHGERTVVRGILEPLDPSLVHNVIRSCGDYDPEITNGFLGRGKGKPIACSTIREILGDFCDHVGCRCSFKKRKDDYAHPLRHLGLHAAKPIPTCPATPVSSPLPETPAVGTPCISPLSLPTPPAPTAPTTPPSNLTDLLAHYQHLRAEIREVNKLLIRAIEDGQHRLPFGELTRGAPDPDLPTWSIRVG